MMIVVLICVKYWTYNLLLYRRNLPNSELVKPFTLVAKAKI